MSSPGFMHLLQTMQTHHRIYRPLADKILTKHEIYFFVFFNSTNSLEIKDGVRMSVYAFVIAQETFEIHTRLSFDAFDVIIMTSLKTSFDVVRALLSAGGPFIVPKIL